MDNDEDRQHVNHKPYAGVGLPGATIPEASSRTSVHVNNVVPADGNLPPTAVPYRWKDKLPQYPAEQKFMNGYCLQNGSAFSLERQSELGVYLNHSSVMAARQGQFNSLPSRTVGNVGPYYNGTHTKSTSSADGDSLDLPPEGVAHNLEQMRLLHKFKELRRHQIQQQEILMQQQEQQLALLRQEMKQRQRQVTTLQPHLDVWKEKQYEKASMKTPPIKRSHRSEEMSSISAQQQIPEDMQKTIYYQLEEDNELSSMEDNDPEEPSHLSAYHGLDGICPLGDSASESETESNYVDNKEINRFGGQAVLSPRQNVQPKESAAKVKLSQSKKNASSDVVSTEVQQITGPSENIHLSQGASCNPLDERPISSHLGRKKTFEQLVEEQLEEEKEQESNVSQNIPVKKPFLRRGQGIARFNPPPDEKSVQRVKKSQRAMSSIPPAVVPTKEINRRPMSQPVITSNKSKATKTESAKLSMKPPKYPTNRQKLKLGVAPKPVPSVTPAPRSCEDQSKAGPFSSSSQSDQSTISFSSVSNAIPTNSKEVEKILRAIYNGKPIGEAEDSSEQVSEICKRISPTNSVEVEKSDLAEFEFMEQMADDMSFCSDSSVVMKFMDNRLPIQIPDSSNSKTSSPNQRIHFGKQFGETRSLSSKLRTHASQNTSESISSDQDDTLVNSDTDILIASPKKCIENEVDSDNQSLLEYEESDIDEAPILPGNKKKDSAIQTQIDHLFENSSLGLKKSDQLSSKDATAKLTRKVTVASQFDFKAMKGSDVVFPPKVLTRKIAPKDDWLKQKMMQDTNSVKSSSSADTLSAFGQNGRDESVDGGTNSDIHSSDECFTDSDTVENSGSNSSRSSSVTDAFDDHDEWNDTCDSVQKNLKHLIPKDPGTEENTVESSEKFIVSDKKSTPSITSPPTSKLVSKLFPVLQPKTTKENKAEEARQCKLQAVSQVPVGDGVQSKLLREKLTQLEKEIARFQKENANLEKLHREREEGVKKLRKEMCEFETAKKEELQKLHDFKEEEMKKLRNERKVFEKYHKAVRSLPNKEQRQEIETLKSQFGELQEEMRRKEARWNSNTNRLRQRIQDLEDENKQLRDEVHFMENKRLEWLQEKESLIQNQKKLALRNNKPQTKNVLTSNSVNSDRDQDSDTGQNEIKVHQMFMASPAGDYRFVGGGKKKEQFERGKVVRTSSEAMPRQASAVLATPQELNNGNSDMRMELNRNPPQRRKNLNVLKHSPIIKGDVIEEVQHPDGKTERRYQSGAREVVFSNGTRKEMSSDGRYIILWFFNGDVKQITEDQMVVYYYAESQTTVTTYADGLEVLEFLKGQTEKHYPDGTQEITFPDQTVKYLRPDGSEESHCQDGTVIKVDANGVRTLEFPNGQREIHTEKFKRREYPDGTQKTIYPDGRQETKFSNGRIRIKDKDGNVLLDKKF